MLLRRDRALTAVAIVLDVAFHAGRAETVNAAEIAERLGLARRGIEPVMQALSRAELLKSVRGPGGGYRLGRARREIRLADIVAAVTEDEPPEPVAQGRLATAVIEPLWAELDAATRKTLAAISIDDLLKKAAAAGLKRAVSEPINFAI
jgi:Rrf2 family protein